VVVLGVADKATGGKQFHFRENRSVEKTLGLNTLYGAFNIMSNNTLRALNYEF
jgi:hypothetical protein